MNKPSFEAFLWGGLVDLEEVAPGGLGGFDGAESVGSPVHRWGGLRVQLAEALVVLVGLRHLLHPRLVGLHLLVRLQLIGLIERHFVWLDDLPLHLVGLDGGVESGLRGVGNLVQGDDLFGEEEDG